MISKDIESPPFLGRTTMSKGGSCARTVRKTSRTRRLKRLRLTAPPKERGTEMPSLGYSEERESMTRICP